MLISKMFFEVRDPVFSITYKVIDKLLVNALENVSTFKHAHECVSSN